MMQPDLIHVITQVTTLYIVDASFAVTADNGTDDL